MDRSDLTRFSKRSLFMGNRCTGCMCITKCGWGSCGCCPCCCSVPISSEKLPLLDDTKLLNITINNDEPYKVIVPINYKKDLSHINESKLRIVTISDCHMKHPTYNMPPGDILIIAGDFTNWKSSNQNLIEVLKWIKTLDNIYKHKIIICGNHETCINENEYEKTKHLFKTEANAIYLQDSFVELFGLKFWGMPWHPKRGCFYGAESFGISIDKLTNICDNIDDDVDILITHVPPQGVMDKANAGRIGSYSLLMNIKNRIKPIMHIFGHIHHCNGMKYIKNCDTLFVNTATKIKIFDVMLNKT
eukprot:116119_1